MNHRLAQRSEVFFVFTRAVHPTIIDASKSVDPETGGRISGVTSWVLGAAHHPTKYGQKYGFMML